MKRHSWNDLRKLTHSNGPTLHQSPRAGLSAQPHSLSHSLALSQRLPPRRLQSSRADNRLRSPHMPQDLSIDQIKTKIREYLQNSCPLSWETDNFNEIRPSKQHFRITLFKNNVKKRLQLKLMQQNYQSQCLKKEFQVKEVNMSKRENNLSRELGSHANKILANGRQRNCRRTVRCPEGAKFLDIEVEPWREEPEFDLEPWCLAE